MRWPSSPLLEVSVRPIFFADSAGEKTPHRVRQPTREGDHPAGDGAYPLHAGRCLARDSGRTGVEQLQVPGIAAGGVACFDVVDAAPGRVLVGVRAKAAAAAVDDGPGFGFDAAGDLAGSFP